MAKSFPPDVIVLDTDGLLHVRLAHGKNAPRIAQAKPYRFAAGTFVPAVVTPELAQEAAFAETLRRLRNETGRWGKVSLLLPDSWFRINFLELPSFTDRNPDALETIRWSLKRTLPIPPEELRITYTVLSRTGAAAKILAISAVEKTLATLERLLSAAGADVVMIEPLGLNLWNAITVREHATDRDRLLVYVRDREFTTVVFRGSQPLFIRSRNLSGERTVPQEIRLSAGYLRDSIGSRGFENCYVAGANRGEIDAAMAAEFNAPVRVISLRDFVEDYPADLAPFDAELAACTGVFTA